MAEYISRAKIAAEAKSLSTHLLNEWDTVGVLALIDRQPAADVAPVVHAHWICRRLCYIGECSNCGARGITNKYCGECGARMDNGVSNDG